jgi:transcriptional regulator with XRE-family HTH domain
LFARDGKHSWQSVRIAYPTNDNFGPKKEVYSRHRSSVVGNKQANAVDAHVGLRIRTARLAAGLSQERLGNELGVTFQQVQKYEKGSNRVGASRLSNAAKILSVPVSFFFENDERGDNSGKADNGLLAMTEALSTPEGIRIARALARISDPNVRRRVADLLEAMVDQESQSAVA